MIVGQAPSRTSDPKRPLTGRTGSMLAWWCGLSAEEFQARFVLRNVLSQWPGPAPGGGDVAPTGRSARTSLLDVLEQAPPGVTHVVLLGQAVRRLMFGPASLPPYEWFLVVGGHWIAWAPHPSRVSRHWNSVAATEAACHFFRRL